MLSPGFSSPGFPNLQSICTKGRSNHASVTSKPPHKVQPHLFITNHPAMSVLPQFYHFTSASSTFQVLLFHKRAHQRNNLGLCVCLTWFILHFHTRSLTCKAIKLIIWSKHQIGCFTLSLMYWGNKSVTPSFHCFPCHYFGHFLTFSWCVLLFN